MENKDNHYRDYLAGEVAEDHALGLMTRREALRRLGMMGFGVAGASALLAACGGDDDASPTTATTAPPASDVTPTTATAGTGGPGTETITFPSGRATPLTGAWAPAPTPKGAVVVIHENRGLTDHIRSVAARLARDGYSAIAVDLLSEDGGSAKVGEADAGAALTAAVGRLVGDVKATLDELERRQPGAKLGVIGFCFGGTTTWSVLGSGEPRVAAAAPFYGTVDAAVDFAGSRAAVLGVYAELDNRVNGTRDTAQAALEKAGLTHELRTFPGADHAFFNDTNAARYNATQAAAAYEAVLDWFGRHLA